MIIAGVGGDLMTELVEAIYQKNSTLDIIFYLPRTSPIHLKAAINRIDFSLKTEA